jgi:hypothetical protein
MNTSRIIVPCIADLLKRDTLCGGSGHAGGRRAPSSCVL